MKEAHAKILVIIYRGTLGQPKIEMCINIKVVYVVTYYEFN